MPDPTRDLPPPDPATADLSAGGTADHTGGTAEVPGPARPPPATPANALPVVPGYELLEQVGQGGMGVVYRARDAALGRDVAVKLLSDRYPPDGPPARRFVDEARITAQLQHPGIPPVHEVGALPDGRPFLAMKLIRGQTLDQLLKGRPELAADRGRFVAAFEAVCQAVGYAHSRGVIHRDLKPQNVMVGAFGEVQVMDWGLAKVLRSAECGVRNEDQDPEPVASRIPHSALRTPHSHGTATGGILGTPAFMPPEQATGAGDRVDARSDVFGLGAVLCAVLTGRPPYLGDSAASTYRLAARADLADARARLAACGADPELVGLAVRCLAADPAGRPADGGAVAAAVAALRAAADERARQADLDKVKADGERAEAEAEARGQARRRRAVQWAAGAVAGVLLLGVAGTAAGLVRADAKRVEAETARQAEADQRAVAEAARKSEADQRQRAETAKAEAEANERDANATVKFFEDKVFGAARPKGQDGGLGAGVTLRAAIVAALPALATGFADQPLVEARLRMTLGTTFRNLGDARAGAEQGERARAIFTARRGPDHPETLSSMNNLAASYFALGRPADALKLGEEAVAGYRRALPPDHPDTLRCMTNLASSYHALGRSADALALRQEALAGSRRALPPDHPATLTSAHNLAVSYDALGRHADALELREEAVAGYRRVLPPDHPDTLLGISNLANTYVALGRSADALELREEAVAGFKRALPADHPETLAGISNLANSYRDSGRHADALALREEALAGFKRIHPRDHPDTLYSMDNLASSYHDLGRHADALALRREALAGFKRTLPPDHPDTLESLWNVAKSLAKLGRGAEAVPLIDECVSGAAGKVVDPDMIPAVLDLRLRHFQQAADPAGCRATAAMWDALDRRDAGSLYDAACMRAVAAAVQAETPGADAARLAAADADRAMAWLAKAVAAGYRDRGNVEGDADLAVLRGRADFRALVGGLSYLAPPPREARR